MKNSDHLPLGERQLVLARLLELSGLANGLQYHLVKMALRPAFQRFRPRTLHRPAVQFFRFIHNCA